MTKITRLLDECRRNDKTCISFEFFPPSTSASREDNLFQRIAEMCERLKPTFISLTWRSGFKDESLWLQIGSKVQKQLGIDVLLHLTCHLPRSDLIRVLKNARAAGIENILALRGDSAHFAAGQQPGGTGKPWRACNDGFQNAIELVHLIRAEHGDHFCVGVAGYPEVHRSSWNSEFLPPSDQARDLDLQRLKDKVDAGADFIITQFVYDTDVFFSFQGKCKEMGIHLPIIPGYAPIQNYSSFQKFCTWVHPKIPTDISSKLGEIKGNDEDVREYGIDIAVQQCTSLLKSQAQAIHFFTLNLASSVASILRRLGLRDDSDMQNRELPFRGIIRDREEIRPIFWAHRQSSYLSRTSTWEEFPNGRWGDARSASTFELADYYLAEKKRSDVDLLKVWGAPQTGEQVADVFVRYMRGEIKQLPWCDEGLALETDSIAESLCWINKHGFLTINSQPKVNGVNSSDKRFGWGGPGGVCFQKAYVEFFCSPENWFKLRNAMEREEFAGRLSYHAINYSGDEFLDFREETNPFQAQQRLTRSESIKLRKDSVADEFMEEKDSRVGRVNAVTWAVFPGREIIQPTVVDTESFRVWKDEAFELWLSPWANLYSSLENGTESGEYRRANEVLQSIHNSWFLVNIVDNDYVSEAGDIFDVFKMVILDDMSPKQLRDRVDLLEKENAFLYRQLLKLKSQLEKGSENQHLEGDGRAT